MSNARSIHSASSLNSIDENLRQNSSKYRFLRRKCINSSAIAVGDAAILTASLLTGGLVRWWLKGDTMVPTWLGLVVVAWVIGSWFMRLLPGWGLGAAEELKRQVLLLIGIFSMTTAAIFLSKASSEASRLTLGIGFFLAVLLLPLTRLQIKRLLIFFGLWGVPTVVYGDRDTLSTVLEALRAEPGLGYIPVGVFTNDTLDDNHMEGLPVLGPLTGLTRIAPIAMIALPSLSRHDLIEMLDGPLTIYRHNVLIPDLYEAPSLWVQPRDLQGLLGLEITSNLLDPFSRILKRSFELSLVLLASPLWIPLCLLIGCAIRFTERKSALFFQERIGQSGRTFKTIKFRTMHPEAEDLLDQKLKEDPDLKKEWQEGFKLREDPRITSIGRFLRRTSLDELPQLINVLMGQISLVGPRPLPTYHYYGLSERVRILRDRVRPGITGLWQVSGRSQTGIEGMERWDTYYVRNWSIWLDLVILFRTWRAVLKREGAW